MYLRGTTITENRWVCHCYEVISLGLSPSQMDSHNCTHSFSFCFPPLQWSVALDSVFINLRDYLGHNRRVICRGNVWINNTVMCWLREAWTWPYSRVHSKTAFHFVKLSFCQIALSLFSIFLIYPALSLFTHPSTPTHQSYPPPLLFPLTLQKECTSSLKDSFWVIAETYTLGSDPCWV